MRHEVRVLIDERQEFTFELVGVEPMAPDVARQWLDEQFTANDCDKVLVVAQAGGAELLADPTWGQTFARAASAALAKPVITVDLATMSVSY